MAERLTPIDLADAEGLLKRLVEAGGPGGAVASVSHLKSALYDWRIEEQWASPHAAALTLEGLGYMFVSNTRRAPRHLTLRHFFVLEEARGKGVGARMMALLEQYMCEHRVRYLRFFANKPAIGFYERLGYRWHGLSKTGLPFTYWDVATHRLAPLPKGQQRYVKTRTFASLHAERKTR